MTPFKWTELPFDEDLTIEGWKSIRVRDKHYNAQNHTRVVWENNNKIFKIWQKNYVRGEYFHQAYEKGFYKDWVVDLSIQIILDGNNCRGYSMLKGEKPNSVDNQILDDFSKFLIKKAEDTRFFYYDLHETNIIKYKGKYYLMDLDSIYPLDEYKIWKNGKHKGGEMVKYCPYENKLDSLFKKLYNDS